MVSSNGQSNGHVEQLPQPVQARPKWAAECRVREYDTGFGVRYSLYHPSEQVLVPSGRSVKWIECTGRGSGSIYGTHADALDALDEAVRLGIAPPEDAEAVACDRTNNTTKGTDAGAEDQGVGGTTRSAAAPKVERPAAYIGNEIQNRPYPDANARAAAEANAAATEKAADWRKTECVIEGPDPTCNDGWYRIRHVPSNCCIGTDRKWRDSTATNMGFGYYFEAPGTPHEYAADRVLASIPDSARPIANVATEPKCDSCGRELRADGECSCVNTIPAAADSQSEGMKSTERHFTPEQVEQNVTQIVSRVKEQAIDATIEKTVNDLADQFGLPKPPDGKGAPSAPSPFADQFGETFAPGMIVEPCLRPGDHYVVDLVTADRMTVIPCGGGVVFTVTPEAVKFWRLSATRSAERPERDPEDIATQILALIDERTLNRVEVRGLVMKLLRCCA